MHTDSDVKDYLLFIDNKPVKLLCAEKERRGCLEFAHPLKQFGLLADLMSFRVITEYCMDDFISCLDTINAVNKEYQWLAETIKESIDTWKDENDIPVLLYIRKQEFYLEGLLGDLAQEWQDAYCDDRMMRKSGATIVSDFFGETYRHSYHHLNKDVSGYEIAEVVRSMIIDNTDISWDEAELALNGLNEIEIEKMDFISLLEFIMNPY